MTAGLASLRRRRRSPARISAAGTPRPSNPSSNRWSRDVATPWGPRRKGVRIESSRGNGSPSPARTRSATSRADRRAMADVPDPGGPDTATTHGGAAFGDGGSRRRTTSSTSRARPTTTGGSQSRARTSAWANACMECCITTDYKNSVYHLPLPVKPARRTGVCTNAGHRLRIGPRHVARRNLLLASSFPAAHPPIRPELVRFVSAALLFHRTRREGCARPIP